jgi:hypothetical protein
MAGVNHQGDGIGKTIALAVVTASPPAIIKVERENYKEIVDDR